MYSNFHKSALFTAGLVALTAAWTTPVSGPEGNPIARPGLEELVSVCEPYQITWEPTTEGTVTILLLRGPSENVVPLYAIAEQIDNTGSFSWDPKYDLEDDVSRYGLQIIADSNGQFQYSTQFGISNPNYRQGSPKPSSCPGEETSSASTSKVPSTTASTSKPSGSVVYETEVVTAYTTYCPKPTTFVMGHKTYTVTSATTLTITDCPCTVTHSLETVTPTHKPTYVASTGYPVSNSTVVKPTGTLTVPSSLRTTTPEPTADGVTPPAPGFTGAAGRAVLNVGGLLVAAIVATIIL